MRDAGSRVCFGSVRYGTDGSLRSLSVAPFIVRIERLIRSRRSSPLKATMAANYSPGMGLMRPAQGLDAVAYMRLGMRPARNPR